MGAFELHPPTRGFYDHNLFLGLVDQIEVALSTSGGRDGVVKWIETNTSDPLDPTKRWSFVGHEYQLGIAKATDPRIAVMKRSQIGVSELAVRITVALCAKLQGRHVIYTLPDDQFAKKFSPTRFEPIIDASPRLQSLVSRDINTQQTKKVGLTYLYVLGAHSESQSISVPASVLVHDETAYSNQEVLGTYTSRLGHLREGQEIVYEFSTPLLPESSIHQAYLDGTQDTYMCYHSACNQWVVLDPIADFIIPGLGIPVDLLSKNDVRDNPDKISQAYVQCPHCKRPIDVENLADPARRAWVSAYPGRYKRSFDANWTVLAGIMTPKKVLLDRMAYRSTEKWINFAIGRPADSADSRISEAAISQAFSLTSVVEVSTYFRVVGMDVGKVCHLCVGYDAGDFLVIAETTLPVQDSSNNSAAEFIDVFKKHRCLKGVIDAMPEFTVAGAARDELPYGQVWGCYFIPGTGKRTLDFYEQKEIDGVVNVQRTKALDEFVNDFNKGRILLLKGNPHRELIKRHLRCLAKVSDIGALGEEKTQWISTGEDHFFFAMFYCWLAWKMSEEDQLPPVMSQSVQTIIGKVKMKT